MPEPRIPQHFIDSADLMYQASQVLAGPVEAAVQALLACVTSGGKVLACGLGGSATLAHHFTALFVGRFERERPELGALTLSASATLLAGSGRSDDAEQVFARQVRALGHPGDVLLVLSTGGAAGALLPAMATAHEREMTVLALTGRGGGDVGAALRETDVHICVPHERPARIHEVHTLVLHCLCDGVDTHLLGEQETTT